MFLMFTHLVRGYSSTSYCSKGKTKSFKRLIYSGGAQPGARQTNILDRQLHSIIWTIIKLEWLFTVKDGIASAADNYAVNN